MPLANSATPIRAETQSIHLTWQYTARWMSEQLTTFNTLSNILEDEQLATFKTFGNILDDEQFATCNTLSNKLEDE